MHCDVSLLGKEGLVNIATTCFENAQYAADMICKLDNFSLNHDNRNFIKEFLIHTKYSVNNLIKDASKHGFNIAGMKSDDTDSLFILAFTEKYKKENIDSFIEYLSSYEEK